MSSSTPIDLADHDLAALQEARDLLGRARQAAATLALWTPEEAKRVFTPEYLPKEALEPDKPKITRTAVEAMRKSKKGVAFDIAQGLGITLGEFAGMLPKLGYVIAKGGKLKSTEP
jgi:hypothetical protein